jgi:hypothetical protein
MEEGGLAREKIGDQMISFGADGTSVFTGHKAGVTRLLQDTIAPFVVGHHCIAHRVQLAASKLTHLRMVERVETLCAGLYTYFNKSPKRYLAYLKIADELGTTGNKMLCMKPPWMSLLLPAMRILEEYKTLMANMAECDSGIARRNLTLLRDFETLLCLMLYIPLLECVNKIIK